ncbi:choice-of-anchor I family protein [Methylocystis echinoides]|uniref:Alkaline phosphatase n=1 Tax=Methylocystis echinoides TaxID=29468 RepID=A0A9W6LU21_9HYPH|nr:choice-of-anchor I family protein [Methylocystis echinoides]GLI95345.1 alkaline phosphatase [Methylocystis echinoides]
MKQSLLAGVLAAFFCLSAGSAAKEQISLKHIWRYQSPTAKFETGASEIVAYDRSTQRIFVVNAQEGTVDVLNATDPAHPRIGQIDLKKLPGFDRAKIGPANSVAARDGLLAVAVEALPKTSPGLIVFYDTAADFSQLVAPLKAVHTGAQPDAVTFSNTGHFVISADEGEPTADLDPEGSVTIVDVRKQDGERSFASCIANFKAFDSERAELIAAGVIVDPSAATVAQDLEPEYPVAIGNNVYVTLQEANAIAVVQINQCRVHRIMPLGFKENALAKNSLDTSDREISNSKGRILLRNWTNLYGAYQPDSIAAFEAGDGKTYLLTANEGDARDPVGTRPGSALRVKDLPLPLCPGAFSSANAIGSDPADDRNLGRLNVIAHLGKNKDSNGNECYAHLYSLGARSFSILTNDGKMVFDSAHEFEEKIANLTCPVVATDCRAYPLPKQAFNANHTNNSAGSEPGVSNSTFDSRSDDKGPEPEAIVVGRVGARNYAFIGLERVGGVMVYDVTTPAHAFFVSYVNFRDFAQPVCAIANADGTCHVPNSLAGDLGPEGLAFVPAEDSPNGRPLLIVGNEVSGSTSIYEIVHTN